MGPTDNGARTKAKRRSENIMDDDIVEEGPVCRRRERLVHYYGTIKGEEVGKTYRSRDKLKIIHHPDKSWIHLGPEGPYSIIVQGKNRFLDEGPLVIVFTKAPVGSSSEESERTASNTVIGNLRKAVKGRLPIRVVRLVKSDRDKKTVFRYDGLYVMKKKLILHEKLHFLLARIRKQPKVKFNIKRGSCKIRRLLALKKRTKQIKKEPVLKKEITSNSDTERDSTQAVEEILNSDQLKEEIATLREEEDTPHCDEHGFEDWQRTEFPSIVKADSNEQLDQSAYLNYDEQFTQMETSYYEEVDDTTENFNNEEDQDHFSKEDVIIESIPLLKSENGESSDDVRTILAIVPESTTEYVEETIDADFDPIHDPLGSFSDDSKTSNCSDEIKITSQEDKSYYDEKKSRELYLAGCGNIEDSVKDQFLPIMPHTCLYNLTIGHLINLLGNRSNNNICPCSTQKFAAQRNFEAALQSLIEEGKKSCNPKCLKGIEEEDIKQLESTEINYFSFTNVFDQFNTILYNNKSMNDTQAPLIGKRKRIRSTKILRKGKTTTKRYSKKVVRVEKSLVSSSINESLVPPDVDDEDHLLHSNAEDSSLPSDVEDSIVTSDVSQPTDPSSPMPEDNTIRLPSVDHQCQEKPLNSNNHHNRVRKGRRRWTRNYSREAAQLGPVIPTDEPKPIPSRLKDKKINYRGASFYISPRNISSRSSLRRKAIQEEEVDFFGFEEPIRPSKKLRLIKSFLNRLISLEQSSLSQ